MSLAPPSARSRSPGRARDFMWCVGAAFSGWGPRIDRPIPKISNGQTCALPPSANSSIPVTKLESSEPRKSATLAISSGSAMRPIGTVDTMRPKASAGMAAFSDAVRTGPGLRTFVRMCRSFSSTVQVRANERIAALVAEATPKLGVPLEPAAAPVRMTEAGR
jgi:hypothetical protein